MKSQDRPSFLATLRVALVAGLIAAGLTVALVFAVILHFRRELPNLSRLESIAPPIKTIVYDRHGTPISEMFQEDRLLVALSEIPGPLVDAFLAVEDTRFREHWGVSVFDTFRAILVNLREGRKAQGGSTITQQLARNLYLSQEKVFTRKIKEALLAIEIEKRYTKDEILEMYLNQIYFGHGAYGVESAARFYFAKSVHELTLPECALLAGIPKNPSGYSPIRHPDAAIGRANTVLDLMVRSGAVSASEADAAREELRPVTATRRRVREAPYFVEHVRQELLARFGPEELYRGGLRILTTLDLEMQHIAEDALEERLADLEDRQGFRMRHIAEAHGDEEAKASGGGDTPYVQGAFLAIDPPTGAILAMVGGRDFEDSHFNRATQAHRQPGSAFKVFVYTAGIDNGMTASDICLDEPIALPVAGGADYRPQNYDGIFRGDVLVRDALAHSINVPAVRALLRFGANTVISYARKLGIASPLKPVYSLALGSCEVTLLEMTSAFATFANRGVRAKPLAILRVEDKDGNVLLENRPDLESALDPRTAFVMTSLLESVVNQGTAVRVRGSGVRGSAAGKTGTPDDYTDGWFVGFTSQIACGAWVGFDKKEKIGEDQTGSRTALPIWTDVILQSGHGDDPPFARPEGITERQICAESGLLVGEHCEKTRFEVYISGTEPTLVCSSHSSRRSDRSGSLVRRPVDAPPDIPLAGAR